MRCSADCRANRSPSAAAQATHNAQRRACGTEHTAEHAARTRTRTTPRDRLPPPAVSVAGRG
jgi:hypothetical protein